MFRDRFDQENIGPWLLLGKDIIRWVADDNVKSRSLAASSLVQENLGKFQLPVEATHIALAKPRKKLVAQGSNIFAPNCLSGQDYTGLVVHEIAA